MAARQVLLAAALSWAAGSAQAMDFDPATLDLSALVECRATIDDYNGFGLWLFADSAAPGRLGWREVSTPNIMLREYRMDTAVEAFGQRSRFVAFTPTGPMLVLDGVRAAELASKLGLSVFYQSGEKFLGERPVMESTKVEGDLTTRARIAINVSTVDSHPGKVLAGCSYSIEVGSGQ